MPAPSFCGLGRRAAAFVMVVAALLADPGCGGRGSPGSPEPPQLTRDQYMARMSQALDAVIKQASGEPQNPLAFGANLWFAHEAWIEGIPQDALDLYVDALREAGVHRIDMNVGLFPWLDQGTPRGDQTIAKYDAIVQRIRSARVQLVLNPQYSPTYHALAGFEGWTQRALEVYEEVARRYQPEILIVVHEPTTMASRLGTRVSASEWADFARRAA